MADPAVRFVALLQAEVWADQVYEDEVVIYIGPGAPRWSPKSWQDVVVAAAGGLLDESHWLELKQDIPPASTGVNTELARDLASLAVDGGLFVVGIEDSSGHAGAVVGAGLTGLAERIDAVARSRVDPPLVVRARPEIVDPSQPHRGVLIVEVPPSGQAPHMVDHVYYGRADRAKMRLSDQQVREIMERRILARADLAAMLRDLSEGDPIRPLDRFNAHMYLIAHPSNGREDALLPLFEDDPIQELATAVLRAVVARGRYQYAPDLTGGSWQRRSSGYTSAKGQRDTGELREENLVELTIREDGGVALLCGRATSPLSTEGQVSRLPMALPGLVVGLTYAALALAGDLAEKHAGYQGQWQLGLRIEGLKGAIASDHRHTGDFYDLAPYDRDVYQRATESTTAELLDHPEAATERLVGQLLRALVVDKRYLPLPSPAGR